MLHRLVKVEFKTHGQCNSSTNLILQEFLTSRQVKSETLVPSQIFIKLNQKVEFCFAYIKAP